MFSAILILLVMPFTDLSRSRGIQFKPLSKAAFFIFVGNFLILMELGAKHVESPFIEFGQISTVVYFAHFLIIVPIISLLENTLIEMANKESIIIKQARSYKAIGATHLSSPTSFKPKHSHLKTFHKKKAQSRKTRGRCGHPYSPGRWHEKVVTWGGIFLLLSLALNVGLFTRIGFLTGSSSHCDAPRPWGIYFQDSATPQMEGLVELHDNILFYLVIILFGVGWLLVSIVKNYTNTEAPISHKYLSHGTLIELIWTITPALILILIAFPSFKLLYLMDEVTDPAMAVLAEGHQWYWSYQYPDFLNSDDEFIEFDSYLVPESDLEDGALRMLEVDNRLIIPELTHVRFIVTGADVIHSLACPALGIKCDAYPGRLNQVSVMINREGVFYGQCSEICGILHSSMPIVIESVSIEKFVSWLQEQ